MEQETRNWTRNEKSWWGHQGQQSARLRAEVWVKPQGTALLFPGKGAVAITSQSLFLQSWAGSGSDLSVITSRSRRSWVHAPVSNMARSKGSPEEPSEMVPPPRSAVLGNREPISELKWGISGHSLPDHVSSTCCSLLHLWCGTSLALIPGPTNTFTLPCFTTILCAAFPCFLSYLTSLLLDCLLPLSTEDSAQKESCNPKHDPCKIWYYRE